MKPSKYRNVKTIIDGITFDSRKEARRYGELHLLVISGIATRVELQPEFPYEVTYRANGKEYSVKRKYIADFKVTYPDRVDIEDVKGMRTREFIQKRKIVEKLYGIKIIEK